MDWNLHAWWAPALAFAAGLVSFASPCVLPLVPGYLSFVSGQGLGDGDPKPKRTAPAVTPATTDGVGDGGALSGGGSGVATKPAVATREAVATVAGDGGGPYQAKRERPLVSILLFVAGFATVFTALGAFTTTFVPILRSEWGLRVAGIVVLAFGTYMILYAFRIGGAWLFAERRPFLQRIKPGKATAYPLGMAFATGFTPCIGPVLAGILGIAAAQGGGAWGAVLMLSYSLGLGLPFLLVGLGVQRLMGALGFVKRNYHWFAGVSGVIMAFIGVLLVLNLWQRFLAETGLLNLINAFEPPL